MHVAVDPSQLEIRLYMLVYRNEEAICFLIMGRKSETLYLVLAMRNRVDVRMVVLGIGGQE